MKFKKSFLFISILLCILHLGAMENLDKSSEEDSRCRTQLYGQPGLQSKVLKICKQDDIEGMTYLLDQAKNDGEKEEMLSDAIAYSSLKCIKFLFNNGVDINAKKELEQNSLFYELIYHIVFKVNYYHTAYNKLSNENIEELHDMNLKLLKFLLEKGADVDKRFSCYGSASPFYQIFSNNTYNSKCYYFKCFYLMLCFKNEKKMVSYSSSIIDEKYENYEWAIKLHSIKLQLIKWRINFLKENQKKQDFNVSKFNLFVFKQWAKLKKGECWEDSYSYLLLKIIIDEKLIEYLVSEELKKDLKKFLKLAYSGNSPSS